MAYMPIEDYALIGDMHTAALVGRNGSIDWLCLPHFDSPSVFAAILDREKGGCFRISPGDHETTLKQLYWPDTNILVTRFLSDHGAAELIDFMPVGMARKSVDHHELIRRVTAVRGEIRFRLVCRPAFDYARAEHRTIVTDGGARFESEAIALGLASSIPLEADADAATAEFTLSEGESAVFCLRMLDGEPGCGSCSTAEDVRRAFRQTAEFWHDWLAKCRYEGRWGEIVRRSALALKLLTFEPTGAIVAAPTTSLPEEIGGVRNWDYRYSWIRDSAFTIYALLRLGFTAEARRYMEFLQRLSKEPGANGPLQLMYGIDGRRELTEQTLDHLEGYRGSAPVRIGNGAHGQLQLDIYGELIDSIYLYDKHAAPISYDTWTSVRAIADWVAENWQREDEGIWEVRAESRQFVHSNLMCWVALDRTVRIARKQSYPGDVMRWIEARDTIYERIMSEGWCEQRGAFVQSFGGRYLDAANLMMPLVQFISPTDPRMLSTLDAVMSSPAEGGLMSNHLVYRYNLSETSDGVPGNEGTFNICTFWLVEALTRAGRYRPEYLEKARLVFERMLGFANPVGLYAEETGPRGEALGNFPQALTHLSLISAAVNLDRALGKNR